MDDLITVMVDIIRVQGSNQEATTHTGVDSNSNCQGRIRKDRKRGGKGESQNGL